MNYKALLNLLNTVIQKQEYNDTLSWLTPINGISYT